MLVDTVALRCVLRQLLVTPSLTVRCERTHPPGCAWDSRHRWVSRDRGQALGSKRRECWGGWLGVPIGSERGAHVPGGEAVRVRVPELCVVLCSGSHVMT